MTANHDQQCYVPTVSCPDRTGIVAAVTGFIADHDGLITEAAHFVDEWSDRSFMRTTFRGELSADAATLRSDFSRIAERADLPVLACHMQKHPSLVPAGVQGCASLSPGLRARREDHRCDGPLCDAGPR